MLSRNRNSLTGPMARLLKRFSSGQSRKRRSIDAPRRVAALATEVMETRALLSALTLSADDVKTGDQTFNAADTASAGDDLTINSDVTIGSDEGDVTLNIGDLFFFNSDAAVNAAGDVIINFDAGSADPGTGSTAFLEGSFSATTVRINGGNDNDSFGLEPASYLSSPFVVDGGGGSQNILELDLTGVTNPELLYNSATSGSVTSSSHADIQFSDIHHVLIFGNTGTFSEITFDLNQLSTSGDGNPDTLQLSSPDEDSVTLTVNTVELFDLDPDDYNALRIIGSSDQDTLLLSHADEVISGAVAFDGGAGDDILSVLGNGTTSAVYTPSATTTGSGTVDVDGNVVTFSGLAPIDVSNMATAALNLPLANDILTIENGLDYATGQTDAMRVSGSSGGVTIESVAFFNNDALTIDTSTVDGVDTITINSVDNNHANDEIAFRTGGDSTDGDVVQLAGNITTSGTHLFSNTAITLTNNIILTSTAGGGVRFLDSPINGAHSLTINAGGVTNLNSAIGDVTPLTSLTTDAAGSTTIAQGDINTSGAQTFNDQVTLSVDTVLTAGTVVLNDSLNASPLGLQTLSIIGDLTLGDGAGDTIGSTNPLGALSVSGDTAFNASVSSGANISTSNGGGNTGNQSFGGAVTLAQGVDVHLAADGGGDISFGSTIDGSQSLTLTTPGTATFSGVVGGTTPLTSLLVNSNATVLANVSTAGSQTWNGDTNFAGGVTLSATAVNLAEDLELATGINAIASINGNVTIGNAADDVTTFDVTDKTTAGTDFDQLQVTGTVTLQGGLNIGGTFAGTGATDDTIMLIDNDSDDAVVGTFDGLASGAAVFLNGEGWRIFYDGGDGNDVVLEFGLASVSIGDAQVVEGDSGTSEISFDVTLDSPAGGAFRVTYATSDNTADSSDYTSENSTLNFAGTAANETQTITISVAPDEVVELDETFVVTLTSVLDTTSAEVTNGPATGTIQNDDAATIAISDVTLSEGNSGTTTFTFDVVLDAAVDTSVAVDFATDDDSALISDSDYAANSGTVTFSGATAETMTIDVVVNGDTTPEVDEAFEVLLSGLNASGRDVTVSDSLGLGTITDDDRVPVSISLNTSSYSGGESSQSEVITITATAESAVPGNQTLTVDLSGTGITASDYTLSNATITILDGETVGTVTLEIVDDALVEATETATVALSNPSAGVRLGSAASVTLDITDNDSASIAISDATIAESDTGMISLTFDVTSTGIVDAPFSVEFITADGSATVANSDYESTTGTLSFDGSDNQTQTITVVVNGDEIVELDETLLVNLSNVSSGGRSVTIADASADGTITNDDAATLSIDDVTLSEGDSGQTLFAFTVTLDSAVQGSFNLSVDTTDDTASAADGDYVAIAAGTLNFAGTAGETQTVTVAVNADTIVEANETFLVNLSNIAAAGRDVTFADAEGSGTINNDDSPTTVALSASTNAGTEADTTVITLTATAATAVVNDQTVDVVVTGVDAGDFTLSGTTITIADGQTTGTVSFTIVDDAIVELTETANVSLANPTLGLSIDSSAGVDVAITDNDAAELVIDDVAVAEGDSGNAVFEFTVTLNNAVDAGFSVDWATADGVATTAAGDYTQSSGTLNFAGTAGETQTLQVSATADEVVELDEHFFVNLSGLNASGRAVTIADNQGRADITNDDAALLSINDVSFAEGDSGNTVAIFTVTLDKAVDTQVAVGYATADLTAVAGDDYAAVTGNTLNFAGSAGETQTLQVVVSSDTVEEADETFAVNLANVIATNRDVTIGDVQGVGTILDDDGTPVGLTASTNTAAEADSTVVTLTATAAAAVTGDQTIDLDVSGLGITAADYVLSATSITILDGETTGTATFTVQNDALVELTETATISLKNAPVALSIGTPSSQNIVITNSIAAEFSIDDVSAVETDSGDTVLEFTVTLDNAVDQAISVDYATVDDSATVADSDYEAATGTLDFSGTAGETQTFQVVVTSDTIVELDETVFVNLSGVSAAGRPVTIGDNLGEGTITNDDAVSLTINDVTAVETDGSTTFTFVISADNAVDTAYTVDYSTVDGTAVATDGDYTAVAATTVSFTGVADETQQVQITVTGDTVAEVDETFTVMLANVVATGRNVTIGDDSGLGTIVDDDGIEVDLTVDVSAGTEAAGTVVTLTATAASNVSGDQTVEVSVAGTGITSGDFVLGSTTITIVDGQTVGTTTFTVQDDSLFEASETATVTISSPSAGIILGATASQDIAITSDDVASVSIADVSVTEGDSGATTLTFTVTADVDVAGGFAVDYTTSDGTANAAADYVAANGTLTFTGTAGETQTFDVTINGDTTAEANETFLVDLSNATAGVTIADAQAVGTITNDDASVPVNISVNTAAGREDDQTVITITATADTAVVGDQSVQVSVSGSGVSAADYVLSSATITILNGQTTGTTTFTVTADGLLEASAETATLTLTNPSLGLAPGSTPSVDITIADDTTLTLDAIDRYPSTEPTLTWQAVPGAVRYEMWFSRIFPDGQRIFSDTNVTGTSWSPPATLASAGYRYWVRAFDAAGNASPWSFPNTFEVRPTLIGPLHGAFTKRPTFEWEPIPFATGYTLFLRTSTGDQVIEDISGTSYTPASDLPDGDTRWWIRVSDAIGNRGWTTAAMTGTQPRSTVHAPTGTVSDTTPTISWSPVSGAGRYVLHLLNTDTDTVTIRENSLTSTSFTPDTALPTGNYRVWVKVIDAATDDFNSGLWSLPVDFTIASADSSTAADNDQQLLTKLNQLPELLAAVEAAPPVEGSMPIAAATQREAERDLPQEIVDAELVGAEIPAEANSASAVELELAVLDSIMGDVTDPGWLFS